MRRQTIRKQRRTEEEEEKEERKGTRAVFEPLLIPFCSLGSLLVREGASLRKDYRRATNYYRGS